MCLTYNQIYSAVLFSLAHSVNRTRQKLPDYALDHRRPVLTGLDVPAFKLKQDSADDCTVLRSAIFRYRVRGT